MKEPTVFIVNKSGHDFSSAHKFGTIQYITDGFVPKYKTNVIYRQVQEALSQSQPEDFIVPTSIGTLNMIVAGEFIRKHGRINLLLYTGKGYLNRTIIFDDRKEERNEG